MVDANAQTPETIAQLCAILIPDLRGSSAIGLAPPVGATAEEGLMKGSRAIGSCKRKHLEGNTQLFGQYDLSLWYEVERIER